MILVTLGTQEQKFYRLLNYIESSNINDRIVVQAGGTCDYKSEKMEIFKFIDYEKMNKLINDADVIITHGGTGSILTPLKKGKKVIACARLQKYNEHINDHQKEIVTLFKDEGYILELDEENDLDDLMDEMKNFKAKKYISNTNRFITGLKKLIDE